MKHKSSLKPLPYDGTVISVGKSKEDIQRLLVKGGAEGVGWQDAYKPKRLSQLVFYRNGKKYRLIIPIHTDDLEKEKYFLSQAKWDDYMAKREKGMFRAMFYYLEGLFKAEQHGLMTFEQAFIGHTVVLLSHGEEATVSEAMLNFHLELQSAPPETEIKRLEELK